jgi:uncharacterized protein RhaS with RHS repeats
VITVGPIVLYYLRARCYDPTTGQFLTVDPAVAKTRSPYAYVAGNPLNHTDHTGLCYTYEEGETLGGPKGALPVGELSRGARGEAAGLAVGEVVVH